MKLVDADALRREVGKLWETEPDGIELCKEIMKAVNHAPTIDVVPVRRRRYEEVSKILRSKYLRGLSAQLADALGNPCKYGLLQQLMGDYCEDRCIVDKDADCWLKLLQKWVKEYV